MYSCWCFWTFRVPLAVLARTDVITLRAMDEGMNAQPRDMYLNPTSMLNNWWFRVAVRRTPAPDGGMQLVFEHPAVVGQTMEGWMDVGVVWSEEPVRRVLIIVVAVPRCSGLPCLLLWLSIHWHCFIEYLPFLSSGEPWYS